MGEFVKIERRNNVFSYQNELDGEAKEVMNLQLFQSAAKTRETLERVTAGLSFMDTILNKAAESYSNLGEYELEGLSVIFEGLNMVSTRALNDSVIEGAIIEKLAEGEI
jgi:hypothetical protein